MKNNWHDIPGYEGLYQFNWHTNQVKSLAWGKEKIRKIFKSRGGNYQVVLYKKGKIKTIQLGLLTLLIKEGSRESMIACHNDGNPMNNFPENLRYGTYKDNYLDAVRHGNHIQPMKKIKRSDGIIFESLSEASKYIGKFESRSTISLVCRGIRKTAYGYRWEYIS